LRLDARRGVDGVTAVHDVLLDVADLRRDDRAAVQPGLELGHDAVRGEVPLLRSWTLSLTRKTQRRQLPWRSPRSVVQVTTTSSPTYW
jgi:hypothetical protein